MDIIIFGGHISGLLGEREEGVEWRGTIQKGGGGTERKRKRGR